MPDLEPITRDEMLWSGENLEPKTRREMYIRHLYDETQVIPDIPKTREEMFILKAGEELHDVTIEQLTATENGTYSEEGVAYSPVIVEVPEPTLISKSITANGNYSASADNADGYSSVSVNVPLPENAYLLQSIEHESIATFTDGSALPMPKLEVAVEPQQDLHGYDAPWVGGAGKNKANIADMNVQSQTTMGRLTLPSGTYVASATVKNNTSIGGAIKINTSSETLALGEIPSASGTSRVSTASFTLSESTEIAVVVSGALSGYNYDVSQVQIELGSTATAFAPYSNICPILGWDEVNVGDSISINEEIESGTLTSDGMNGSSSTRIRTKNYISLEPNTTYLIDWDSDSITYFGLKGYAVNDYTTPSIQGSDWIAKGSTITTDANVNYIRANFRNNSNTNVSPSEMGKLRVTPISNYYTLDLDGTRYGGTLDVVSGELVVDRAMVNMGDLTWTYHSASGQYEAFFDSYLPNDSIVGDSAYSANIMTPIYKVIKSQNIALSGYDDGVIALGNNTHRIISCDKRFTDATTYKNAMSGMKLVYELATPTTIQLTPTQVKSLLGSNNVWCDTGDIIELEYFSKEV